MDWMFGSSNEPETDENTTLTKQKSLKNETVLKKDNSTVTK